MKCTAGAPFTSPMTVHLYRGTADQNWFSVVVVKRSHIDQIRARVLRRLFLKSIYPKDFRNRTQRQVRQVPLLRKSRKNTKMLQKWRFFFGKFAFCGQVVTPLLERNYIFLNFFLKFALSSLLLLRQNK